MREVNLIVVHCTATPPSMDIGVEEVRRMHVERGWRDVGYHAIIRRSGTIEHGRKPEQAGAHVLGRNADSLGVALVGGVNENGDPDVNYTSLQWYSLDFVVTDWYTGFGLEGDIDIRGHRDFANKACPCFDVQAWWNGRGKV